MELLTIAETAKLLKVTPTTVRRYITAGQLPALKVGRGVRIRKEAVDDLLAPIVPERRDAQGLPRRHEGRMAETNGTRFAPMTDEQARQALVAVERARVAHAEQLARRHGEPFSPSWELLYEAREERARDPG